MALKRNNPGCNCCEEAPDVDIIVADDEDNQMDRWTLTTSGKTLVWTADSDDYLTGAVFGGANYAPSFDGEAVVGVYDTAPLLDDNFLYTFDIDTGLSTGLLSTLTTGAGNHPDDVYEESDGYVGFGAGTPCRVVDAAGAVTTSGSGSHGGQPFCRASDGGIWKIAGDTKIYDHASTVRHDLAGDLVNATKLAAIVSTDGDTFYVLATDSANPVNVELLSVTLGGTITALGAHTVSAGGLALGTIRTFTKIGNFLFWCPEVDQVWRSNTSGSISMILERTGGSAWALINHSLGTSFFVPRS